MKIILHSLFTLQIIKVCRTDCIKVQNLKEGVKDHHVKIALMNKKLTTGRVTMVERNFESSSKTAFVHYANFKGKERWYTR